MGLKQSNHHTIENLDVQVKEKHCCKAVFNQDITFSRTYRGCLFLVNQGLKTRRNWLISFPSGSCHELQMPSNTMPPGLWLRLEISKGLYPYRLLRVDPNTVFVFLRATYQFLIFEQHILIGYSTQKIVRLFYFRQLFGWHIYVVLSNTFLIYT